MNPASEGWTLLRHATTALQSRTPVAVGLGTLIGLAGSGVARTFFPKTPWSSMGTLPYVAAGMTLCVLVALARTPKLSARAEATLEYLARTASQVGPVERAWMHKQALSAFLKETYEAPQTSPRLPPVKPA